MFPFKVQELYSIITRGSLYAGSSDTSAPKPQLWGVLCWGGEPVVTCLQAFKLVKSMGCSDWSLVSRKSVAEVC